MHSLFILGRASLVIYAMQSYFLSIKLGKHLLRRKSRVAFCIALNQHDMLLGQ